MKCIKCGYISNSRSNQQNRWYRGVIVPMIATEAGYTIEEQCHEDLKQMFNPKPSLLNPEATVGGTTTAMTTKEFTDYCERICIWALEFLKLDIPRPLQTDTTGEY